MKHYLTTALLLLCLSFPAIAATQTWQHLEPAQQQALAPLAQQWNSFSEKQQKALLRVAKRYPSLSPLEKQRLQQKLIAWSKLSPEQRMAAREKYRALSKNPAERDAKLKKLQPRPHTLPASSPVAAASSPAIAVPITSAVSSLPASAPRP